MAIFTFSTKDKRPDDAQLIKEIKQHCERKNMNFSSLVVNLLREYKSKTIDKPEEA